MYRSFTVKNFRCFRTLALTDLERVNLITGKNNVGKTALLEALFIHCGMWKSDWALPWDTLFKDFDISQSVQLEGDDELTGHRALSLKLIRDPRDLAQLRASVIHNNGSALVSTETVQVLELEYHQEGEDSGYAYRRQDPAKISFEGSSCAPGIPNSSLSRDHKGCG